jgi:hypothetical protein
MVRGKVNLRLCYYMDAGSIHCSYYRCLYYVGEPCSSRYNPPCKTVIGDDMMEKDNGSGLDILLCILVFLALLAIPVILVETGK